MTTKKTSPELKELLKTEDKQLQKLNELILEAINEEELITKNVEEAHEELSLGDKLSDKVADFGGSWKFIITFMSMLVVWIIINAAFLHEKGFDPYPFILLNLILSCIAALQAPVIMMSQNRKEDKDRQRAQNDYAVNLKSEIEIRKLNQKIDFLMMEQLKMLIDIQNTQLKKLETLDQKIDKHLVEKAKSPS